ncbi:MAG TPA: chromate efflux transporter [Turneriella sp.]|nr:chromate efflux transporter [Turneriella sp.]
MKTKLLTILALFTRLGVTAFGGPVAHIALMRHEFVARHRWLSDEKFVELISLTNLIPGPNSTEMAIHLGYERAGRRGSVLAGLGFIVPAVIITLGIAWFYGEYGTLLAARALLFGIKPAIIAVIVFAVLPLFKSAVNTLGKLAAAAATVVLCFLGMSEVLVMLGVGVFFALAKCAATRATTRGMQGLVPFFLLQPFFTGTATALNTKLFLIFLKIGSILYGSGYVLFAFLDAELVTRGLLPRSQLMDAVAVGQITPGPVFSAVTFIGYQVNGFSGAIVSTVAIFLPSFIFVIATHSLLPRLRKSTLFSAFLGGVNAASLAIMLFALVAMSRDTFTHWSAFMIAALSGAGLYLFKNLGSTYVVLFGAAGGIVLSYWGIV